MKKNAFNLFDKNFRLKSVVALLLALSLVLCGCGAKASDPTDPSADPTATTQSVVTDETGNVPDASAGADEQAGQQAGGSQSSNGGSYQPSNGGSGSSSNSGSSSSSSNSGSSSSSNSGSGSSSSSSSSSNGVGKGSASPVSLAAIPNYSGSPYVKVDNNVPNFSAAELTTSAYESYSNLDSLGRARTAVASLGKETMPAAGEDREDISSIKPTGWIQAQYDCINGRYLYNRCHLIGWQLSAENANRSNLITGTRYLNASGMLPFENMVSDYINSTGNHVAYRVTPIYNGNNLLASGVQMEAYSIEDNGAGICFNVFCYNVQPDVELNYATGASNVPGATSILDVYGTYVLNTNSKKFHKPTCTWASQISDKNRGEFTGYPRDLEDGYSACGTCCS